MERFKDLQEELIKVVNDYLVENYDYNYADVLDNEIVIHLDDNDNNIVGVVVEVNF